MGVRNFEPSQAKLATSPAEPEQLKAVVRNLSIVLLHCSLCAISCGRYASQVHHTTVTNNQTLG